MQAATICRLPVAVMAGLLNGLCIAEEAAPLLGEWTVVAMERRGKAVEEISWAGMSWTFSKDAFEVQPGRSTPAGIAKKPPLKCSYTLDDTKTPHHFNWTMHGGGKTKDIKAICELTDDVLRVCFSKGGTERPKDFNTRDTESVVYTFKRTKAP